MEVAPANLPKHADHEDERQEVPQRLVIDRSFFGHRKRRRK